MIRVWDEAGNVVETHEHTSDFKEPAGYFHSQNSERVFPSASTSYSNSTATLFSRAIVAAKFDNKRHRDNSRSRLSSSCRHHGLSRWPFFRP